jgi:GNAT superfamily N-acetyltransferase
VDESPRLAGPEDIARFAETFAAAMFDDPMIRWPLPDEVTLATVTQVTRPIVQMYVEIGSGWMLADGLAVASWIAPDAAARFDELELPTRAAIAPHTGDGGVRYGRFWDWLAHHVPEDPCWFLDLVAVHPEAQGRGFGRRLVEHGLSRARADGLPAFLETAKPENLPFYTDLGFTVVAEEDAPDGGPHVWFMRT